MKLRSLLLGLTALTGLTTASYATDLGVLTTQDMCDELGLNGLSLGGPAEPPPGGDALAPPPPGKPAGVPPSGPPPSSGGVSIGSADTCLTFSGGIDMYFKTGNYRADWGTDGNAKLSPFPGIFPVYPYVIWNSGGEDSLVDIDVWWKIVASSATDFGPASATIKLLLEDSNGTGDASPVVDDAYVSIGDQTMLMAGRKSTIFNRGDDDVLSGYPGFFGLYYGNLVTPPPATSDLGPPDSGAGRYQVIMPGQPNFKGSVIQVVSDLGNGVTLSGGLEGIGQDNGTALVGVVAYQGDGISTHLSGATNIDTGEWITHAGFKGTWDSLTFTSGLAADSTGYWNGTASASVGVDIFKLAASGEYVHFEGPGPAEDLFGAGASISALVSPDVTLNGASRYITNLATSERAVQFEAMVDAAVMQTLNLSAAVGVHDSTFEAGVPDDDFPGHSGAFGTVGYARAGAFWRPGGGFTGAATATAGWAPTRPRATTSR
jgi:hypothetical protein